MRGNLNRIAVAHSFLVLPLQFYPQPPELLSVLPL